MQSCRNALEPLTLNKGTHAGLLLARYLKKQKEEGDSDGEGARQELLKAAIGSMSKGHDLYKLAYALRKKELSGKSNGTFEVAGRMIVGLGGSSVLETGLTLNHIYGTPIIPGSALKGLAAHYCSEVWGKANPKFKGPQRDDKENIVESAGEYYRFIFGETEEAGYITFYDAWIDPLFLGKEDASCFVLDVMTPHHGDYYLPKTEGKRQAPSDTDDPVPVTFLSVTGKFEIYVSCDGAPDQAEQKEKSETLVLDLLTQALQEWGIGGKTSSGYGMGKFNKHAKPPSKRLSTKTLNFR